MFASEEIQNGETSKNLVNLTNLEKVKLFSFEPVRKNILFHLDPAPGAISRCDTPCVGWAKSPDSIGSTDPWLYPGLVSPWASSDNA